ncbi:2Fe-2S ferredoxin [Maritimibacter alkaliphilus HTCC2654]|uniref:Iron-sulfur cluster-binding protein n=1 Tax=Maritimibacter alkaliphilus HTCC2654 TaxID=314271 RepID=A3VDM4_9RHOB|nr:2Fe-2S iron-sulfur cluster-binding protein [Maritimibacter alkaliphilus]EAQ13613.1 iron-sulfur cluster-binding protein [Maritimibacter alkaliphilus HTCC2654]TYP83452.1 2Fe-2S ferredoxin [Maritimibacter alkaliphilus HTCC2654]
MKIAFLTADGNRIEAQAQPGASVMEIATGAGVPGIIGECSGSMACGTCHCKLTDDRYALVGPPGDDEAAMLEFSDTEPTATSRLSCQIALTPAHDGLIVHVPPWA